jgi:hypothetical protein
MFSLDAAETLLQNSLVVLGSIAGTSKMSAMVDLSGPLPNSAAASLLQKVSR